MFLKLMKCVFDTLAFPHRKFVLRLPDSKNQSITHMLFLQKIVSNCFLSALQKLHPWRWQTSHLYSPLSLQGSMPLSPEGKLVPQGNCKLPLFLSSTCWQPLMSCQLSLQQLQMDRRGMLSGLSPCLISLNISSPLEVILNMVSRSKGKRKINWSLWNPSCCDMQKSESFIFYSVPAAVLPSLAGRGTDFSMQ